MNEQPIFSVDPAATGLTPVQFLRYFYYGGIAYTGVKQWKEALDSFLTVSIRALSCSQCGRFGSSDPSD